MRISGYVPCCNNAETIRAAVGSLLAQNFPPAEVIVVDDGSTDNSASAVHDLPVRYIRQEVCRGRGAVRSLAMEQSSGDLVVCVDATNVLPEGFVRAALKWFEDKQVAAVFGRISDPAPCGVVARWRARHLFKDGAAGLSVNRKACLATYGAVIRRNVALTVGNYDAALRHSEDRDLGARLLAAGWDVICDPNLVVHSNSRNSLWQVLERYWRWYAGSDEGFSFKHYVRAVWYSVKVMGVQDLNAGDVGSVGISLLCPHYQFWKSALRWAGGRRQQKSTRVQGE